MEAEDLTDETYFFAAISPEAVGAVVLASAAAERSSEARFFALETGMSKSEMNSTR